MDFFHSIVSHFVLKGNEDQPFKVDHWPKLRLSKSQRLSSQPMTLYQGFLLTMSKDFPNSDSEGSYIARSAQANIHNSDVRCQSCDDCTPASRMKHGSIIGSEDALPAGGFSMCEDIKERPTFLRSHDFIKAANKSLNQASQHLKAICSQQTCQGWMEEIEAKGEKMKDRWHELEKAAIKNSDEKIIRQMVENEKERAKLAEAWAEAENLKEEYENQMELLVKQRQHSSNHLLELLEGLLIDHDYLDQDPSYMLIEDIQPPFDENILENVHHDVQETDVASPSDGKHYACDTFQIAATQDKPHNTGNSLMKNNGENMPSKPTSYGLHGFAFVLQRKGTFPGSSDADTSPATVDEHGSSQSKHDDAAMIKSEVGKTEVALQSAQLDLADFLDVHSQSQQRLRQIPNEGGTATEVEASFEECMKNKESELREKMHYCEVALGIAISRAKEKRLLLDEGGDSPIPPQFVLDDDDSSFGIPRVGELCENRENFDSRKSIEKWLDSLISVPGELVEEPGLEFCRTEPIPSDGVWTTDASKMHKRWRWEKSRQFRRKMAHGPAIEDSPSSVRSW